MPLNQSDQQFLLRLARRVLEYYFQTGQKLKIKESDTPQILHAKQGAFVTLTKNGNLRGCIGYLEPIGPLYQAVIDNALSAAIHDGRFKPVEENELKDIKIEISVLSVPQESAALPADRPIILKPLIDGVILQEGHKSSTYLPQVWEEIIKPVDFLDSLCEKGEWEKGCWKNESVKMLTYQAEVFGENY